MFYFYSELYRAYFLNMELVSLIRNLVWWISLDEVTVKCLKMFGHHCHKSKIQNKVNFQATLKCFFGTIFTDLLSQTNFPQIAANVCMLMADL